MAQLVGILNLTPDSFSDGGLHDEPQASIAHARSLLLDGAAWIDVGAESTRPGATAIGSAEEITRLGPFIRQAAVEGWPLSIDTYHAETIAWVQKVLPDFTINDVTGFRDPEMRAIAASTEKRLILSHLPAICVDVQEAHSARALVDSLDQVTIELRESIEALEVAGVAKERIIVDPGIGFGKTERLNWKLLEFATEFPDHEVMVGYSRKRFLGENRGLVEANLRAGRIAVEHGAKYLRVHDVRSHRPLAR